MDDSIMKLLEEDVDESLHSGADVEAFTAALNRDIGGEDTSISQPVNSDAGISHLGSNPAADQLSGQWHASAEEDKKQEQKDCFLPQEQHSFIVDPLLQGVKSENQSKEDGCPHEQEKLSLQHGQSRDSPLLGDEKQRSHFNLSQDVPVLENEKLPSQSSQPLNVPALENENLPPQSGPPHVVSVLENEKPTLNYGQPRDVPVCENEKFEHQQCSQLQDVPMLENEKLPLDCGQSQDVPVLENEMPPIQSSEPLAVPKLDEKLQLQRSQLEDVSTLEKEKLQLHGSRPQNVSAFENEKSPFQSSQPMDIPTLENDKIPLQGSQPKDDLQHRLPKQNAIEQSEKNQDQIFWKDSVQKSELGKFYHSENQQQQPNNVQQPELGKVCHSENQLQHPKPLELNSRQAPGPENTSNSVGKITFYSIIPILRPNLDKDRRMQLDAIFNRLRKNEVNKEDFLRVVRHIVGDQLLKQAAHRVQMQQLQAQALGNTRMASAQNQFRPQASLQQSNLSSSSAQKLTETKPLMQCHSTPSNHTQKPLGAPVRSVPPASSAHVQAIPTKENLSKGPPNDPEHQSGLRSAHVNQIPPTSMGMLQREREHSMISASAANKQQQMHQPPTSFAMYGGAVSSYNTHGYSGSSAMQPVPHSQGSAVSTQPGASLSKNPMNAPRYEHRSKSDENTTVQAGFLSHVPNQPALPQNSVVWQSSLNKDQISSGSTAMAYPKQELAGQMAKQHHTHQLSAPQNASTFVSIHIDQNSSPLGSSKEDASLKQSAKMGFPSTTMTMANQISPGAAQVESHIQAPSATTTAGVGTNARTPPKKPPVGQKRPSETVSTPSTNSSKKQKVSGAPLDQSIEHLNDVTAVSGVNLREEEEQLLSAPKEDSRASEATRRVVQEEEERLILQRGPLRKKIAEIISKCGLKSTSNDVERCLSLCVEERMRGLICTLIRLSKQRVDIEKPKHKIFITSDVRRQILMMNRKAKEDWEKKQAEEAEKLRKLNEIEGNSGVDADREKDKDEGRSKSTKANKEEDDKMRTTAANVAARAAVGGDDMLSKWQLMAEQARQKREGGQDGASSSQPAKDQNRRPLSGSVKSLRDNQEADRKGSSAGSSPSAMRKFGRNVAVMPQTKVVRTITVKDIISLLEREPQMSRSTLIYRLYERTARDSVSDL